MSPQAPDPNVKPTARQVVDAAQVQKYRDQLRTGFSFENNLTHFEELITEGFSVEQAMAAVRIAERRETVNLYRRCSEVIHHLCSSLGGSPAGVALRRALGDDGRSQAQAAQDAGITKQTLSKSEMRIKQRITKTG